MASANGVKEASPFENNNIGIKTANGVNQNISNENRHHKAAAT